MTEPAFNRRIATKAIKWAQAKLALRDWKITLDMTSDGPQSPPHGADNGECGSVVMSYSYKLADIWISPSRSREQGLSPLGTLFHELLHIAFDASGDKTRGDWFEFLLNNLEGVCRSAFLADLKRSK